MVSIEGESVTPPCAGPAPGLLLHPVLDTVRGAGPDLRGGRVPVRQSPRHHPASPAGQVLRPVGLSHTDRTQPLGQ